MGSEETQGLTIKEVLHQADAQNLGVSRDQLDRWRRRGLLPQPVTENRGGRTGQRSVYPSDVVDQLRAITDALKQDRRLDRAAFLLWWWGYDVDIREVRVFLTTVAARWDESLAELRRLAEDDDAMAEFIEESGRAKVRNNVMGRARRRVGRNSFPTVFRILLQVGSGSFNSLYRDYATEEDEGVLFERALGLTRARTEPLPDGAPPWLSSDPEENLHDLSSLLAHPISSTLEELTDEELVSAREEMVPIAEVFALLSGILEAERGADAYGITEFGRVIRDMTPTDLAQFFVVWLRLRAHPDLRPGIEELNVAANDVLAASANLLAP